MGWMGWMGWGWTGRIWGVRVGCRSIDRLLCSHSPGRACTLSGSHMSDYGDDEALAASNGPSASAMLGPITQWLRP